MSKSDSHNKENDAQIAPDPEAGRVAILKFSEWLTALSGSELVEWNRLPDIGLYMDQVLTLMDRQLAFYKRADDDRLLTQPMINNYTKDGLLPRASDKKYTQGHLALLSVLCSLKPVLSISDLSVLLRNTQIDTDEKKIYEFFLEAQSDSIDCVRKDLTPEIEGLMNMAGGGAVSADTYKHELALMALRTAVEARVRIMMTQKILDLIAEEDKK